MPSSSSSSRCRASRARSPWFDFPSGKFPLQGHGLWRVRWQARMFPSLKIKAATTRFMGGKDFPNLGDFPVACQPGSAILDQAAVFITKRGRKVAVDIEFAHHPAADENRDHDFRFGFGRAAPDNARSRFTSSTTRVFPVEAAAPQMPWFRGMRVCGVIAP